MDSYGFGKSVGIATGIIFGLLICLILFRFINRDKKFKTKYDERQEAVRGTGYMYGFWGCMIGAALVIIADCGGLAIANRLVMDFFIVFIGIIVQVTYCIWNDGYYGINTNKKRFYIICIAAALCNLLAVVGNIKGGQFIIEGVMQDAGVNLLCVILFLVIGIELIIKDIMDKKQDTVAESEE
ncbi:MAG: hypothetical protein K6F87_08895 [Lachnospiraceae bacterium]|nr:hypothetical protein [Lachnospiraceae bacterium]